VGTKLRNLNTDGSPNSQIKPTPFAGTEFPVFFIQSTSMILLLLLLLLLLFILIANGFYPVGVVIQ
jgi:hypothetical protein